MKKIFFSSLLFVCCTAQAEIIEPGDDVSEECGKKIKTKNVMVLDLETFGEDSVAARRFVEKHAGNHTIMSEFSEEIRTSGGSVFYDRQSGIKRAAKVAAKRGCDLVLVLHAEALVVDQKTVSYTQGGARASGSSKTDGSFYGNTYTGQTKSRASVTGNSLTTERVDDYILCGVSQRDTK